MNICYSNNDSNSFLTIVDNSVTWDARLDHIGQERMNRSAREGLLGQLAKVSLPTCKHCLSGKSTRKPFGKTTRASSPLKLIHFNIYGPMSVRAQYGATYFITFINDYTRYGHIFFISHKSEALECFRRYLRLVENQKNGTLKALCTNQGGEYLSEMFKKFYNEKEIKDT